MVYLLMLFGQIWYYFELGLALSKNRLWQQDCDALMRRFCRRFLLWQCLFLPCVVVGIANSYCIFMGFSLDAKVRCWEEFSIK